jgi:hypothetical protein
LKEDTEKMEALLYPLKAVEVWYEDMMANAGMCEMREGEERRGERDDRQSQIIRLL